MDTNVVSSPLAEVACDWLIVTVSESSDFATSISALDAELGGRLTRLREAGDLTGKAGETLEIRDALEAGPRRIMAVGLGDEAEFSIAGIYKSLMTAVRKISSREYEHVATALPVIDSLDPDRLV